MNDVLKRMSFMLPSFGMSGCIVVTKKPQTPDGDAKIPKGDAKVKAIM